MSASPLVFLDTETTGVHPEREVWEVGMIRREPDGTERETHLFVAVDLSRADPFGLSVGRFYERHPAGRALAKGPLGTLTSGFAYAPAEAAQKVASWTHGAHIVGAVPSFDTISLDAMLRADGLIPAWHYHLIDVENLAVGYLCAQIDAGNNDADKTGMQPPWDSRQLGDMLGITPQTEDEQHTALGDARWAKQMYDAVMEATA